MTKELAFYAGKITSQPKPGSWSTAFEFVPPSESQKASRGVLVAAASIEASEKFDAELVGHQILSSLQENYYSQETGGILPALERAVLAAHQRLVTLVFSGTESEDSVDFNLVVGVLWGSVFYLALLGDGKAIIRRGGALKLIGHRPSEDLESLAVGDKPDIRTASGEVEVDEKIALTTPKFYEIINADELSKTMAMSETDAAVIELTAKVGDEASAAALILSLGEEGPAQQILPLPSAEEFSSETQEVSQEVAPEEEDKLPGPEPSTQDSEAIPEPAIPPLVPVNEVTAPSSDLSERVSDDLKKYTNVFSSLLSKAAPAARQGLSGSHRLARQSAWPKFRRGLAHLWDRLGSPRTALESAADARNRRSLLILAGALLVILVAGVLLHNSLSGGSDKKAQFDTLIKNATGEYSEAQSTAPIDRSRATSLLGQAQYNLQQADALNVDDNKVHNLQSQVSSLLETVNQVYKVSPSVFYDVSGIRTGAEGVDLTGDKNTLYVLDPTGGLYQVATAGHTGLVLSSDLSLAKSQSLAMVGQSLFALVPNQGIFGFDLKTKKLSHPAKPDASWGKITDMSGYLSYLYLLDSGKNAVWRYAPASSAQLGSSSTWLKDSVDLSHGLSLSIDGSVWVGGGSDVSKFNGGKKDSFNVQGVEPGLTSVKSLYTAPEAKNLYILEPTRLVIVDKSGTYVSQYQLQNIKDAASLVVDEAGLKTYILAGNKIYLLELKP